MKRIGRYIAALVLAASLLAGDACAAGLGLDAALDSYLGENSDVRYGFSISLGTLLPYGDGPIELMNGVLKHINVAVHMTEEGETVALCVDDGSVAELTQRDTAAGTELTSTLLPNRTLTSAASAMDALSGMEQEEPAFDALRAIREAEGCYTALTDAIAPYAEEKKANYKIKDIGYSRWSRVARLSVEQSAELAPLIAQVLGCGMDEAFREQLNTMTYGKGFVVALYQDAQGGTDMAVYMKGNVTFADGSARALSYQWAFTGDEQRKDTYKFELTKKKSPVESRIISASYTRKDQEGVFQLKGSSSTAVKAEGTTRTTVVKHDLAGEGAQDARTLKGSVETTRKTTGSEDAPTKITTIRPDVKLTSSEGSGVLSGTAEVEETTDKDVTLALTLTFDESIAQALAGAADSGALFAVTDSGQASYAPMPESSLTQNEGPDGNSTGSDYLVGQPPIGYTAYTTPASMQVIDLDAASAEQLEALMAEMAQNLAAKLLPALARLPQEDTGLLSDNMSQEDYVAFLKLLENQ
ncbi:MAG: hypothetical protein MRZ54_00520 [Clostridiales bacterium]|nr:hypothetical protein [Clostridiales bacterium]